MKKAGNNTDGNRGTVRSQRRLALTVLLLLLIAGMYFIMSDSPLMSALKARFSGDTGTVEISEDYDGTGGSGQGGEKPAAIDTDALPEYAGENYTSVNGSMPAFPEDAYSRAGLTRSADEGLITDGGSGGADVNAGRGVWSTEGSRSGKIDSGRLNPYEFYGELDNLGRCTVAYGCLGEETMPAQGEERGDISSVHPSGWARAQNWERSHLIAWALGAENANERNLITGTHYLNYDGMRPLEEEVEHYIWDTGNHVLYMSRPLFSGNELVPRGVQMSAWSCEDQGEGVSFNVYCFNVTPGAEINYMNGVVTTGEQAEQDARLYVVNLRSGVFHYPSCDGAKSMSRKNRKEVTATRKELTDQGYVPCGACEP